MVVATEQAGLKAYAVAAAPIFHGTPEEIALLLAAVARYCECGYGLMGVRISTCGGHTMMVSDQRALDGLVFERRWCAQQFPGAGLRVVRPG